jgi:Ca2+/Na+ antiporter
MEDNEIQIGHKKFGMSTEITFTVKTLMWILGILFSLLTALFTWFYFNTQERENALKKEMSSLIKEYHSDVKTDIKSIEQQVFMLAQGQGEIKTDLKTVINRQVGSHENPSEDLNSRNITPLSPVSPR